METVLRVFQVFVAVALIGVVLLQRSEGGGLGIGSSGGAGSFMSVRGTANLLTRITAILAGLFMVTCLALVLLATPRQTQRSIFDTPTPGPAAPQGEVPAQAPAPGAPPALAPVPQLPVPQSPASTGPQSTAPLPAAPAAVPQPQSTAPATQPATPKKPVGSAAPRGQ